MTGLNELTKQLFSEGWTENNHPDWVRNFNKWYGGFEYTLEAQRKLVFKTPCGLFVKGGHWNAGHMSYMGVDWTLENGNPTLNCPYRNAECTKRHELLRRQKVDTSARTIIVYCDCAPTNEDYDYERSIDKVLAEHESKKLHMHKEFQKTHRHCPFQDYWSDGKGRWKFRYNPFICATNHCQYCTALRRDMSPETKGNVFYDLKITRRGEDKGLFTQDFETQIIKGKRLFEKSIPLSVADIIAKSFRHEIQSKEEMRHHSELFFSEHYGRLFKIEVLNVRAEKRVSRDLEQDLKDLAEGITVTHESDLIAEKKEQKHQRRTEARTKKIKRLLKIVFEKGLDNLNSTEWNSVKKYTRTGLLDWCEISEADENGKKQKEIQQLSLF